MKQTQYQENFDQTQSEQAYHVNLYLHGWKVTLAQAYFF